MTSRRIAEVVRASLLLLTPPCVGYARQARAAKRAIAHIRECQRQMLRAGIASRPDVGLFAQAAELLRAVEAERATLAAWAELGIEDVKEKE